MRTCPNQVRTVITYIETVMRWIYKTVHFELKKEGLLGSPFLDRSEIELSLNEYGRAGWELISTTEVSDGILAIFKQPLRQTRKKKEPAAQQKSFEFPDSKKLDRVVLKRNAVTPESEKKEDDDNPEIGVIPIE